MQILRESMNRNDNCESRCFTFVSNWVGSILVESVSSSVLTESNVDQDVNAILGRSPNLKCHQMSFPSFQPELYQYSSVTRQVGGSLFHDSKPSLTVIAFQLSDLSYIKGRSCFISQATPLTDTLVH
jgi:hypothetical protein